ncbi:ABC transporter substrate-binding protein [Saccharopolyspora sp. HNM0983]|uniref:ABC transporter substrate-binding protein n=1 Tax=Saccharopolyspora montiporae TaxID=2781240 RepID=A0A929B9A8_9PSEU|nr:ABC transporter substrate-binding protein [Saccharopolyspora sp. HNM0983]MBE9373518.1 ABC transporter substrate-binding protein [Saccharopolyspora sp. HNM0983]
MAPRIARPAAALSALLLLVGLLAGCGTRAPGDDVVDVRTDVAFTGAMLPLLVGVDRGIYRAHGLDVRLNSGNGSATTIQTVANGSDDLGYADATSLVQSAAEGVPVRMVAGMVQRSPLAVFSKPGSGIDEPADLAGTEGGYVPGSAPEMLFPAFAAATGVDTGGIGLPRVDVPAREALFLNDRVQFTFGLTNVSLPKLREKCDCAIRTIAYREHGLDALSSGIVVGDRFAAQHPGTVRAFLAATAEATRAVLDDPDAAVRSYYRLDESAALSPDLLRAQWDASARLLRSARTRAEPFGCTDRADWADTIRLVERGTGTDPGLVQPGTVATNEFLPGDCDPGRSPGASR